MPSYSELRPLFLELCDLPLEERATRLAELDPTLREPLQALFVADDALTDADAELPLPSELAWEDPTHIGSFTVTGLLGSGGMGRVYAAEQDHPRRQVALKLLAPWLRNEAAMDLFRFEAQALSQVDHPGVPAVFEAGDSSHGPYLTMARVDGPPLLEWCSTHETTPVERLLLGIKIVEAVEAVHAAGVLHLDLKPSNVAVESGQPKLLDFGIAIPLDAGARRHPGTAGFMPPEQIQGESLGPEADVYALGVLLWRMCTGSMPPARPQPSSRLTAVLCRALEPDREQRLPTAGALRVLLVAVRDGAPLPWDGTRERATLWWRKNRRAVALTTAIAGVLLGLVGAPWVGDRIDDAMRAQVTARRWDATRREVEALHDDPEAADAVFEAFALDPEHQGTDTLFEAWMWWADRAPEPEAALSSAYVTASRPAQRRESQQALARAFDRSERPFAFWQLWQNHPEAVGPLHDETLRAALALRRPGEVAPAPDHPDAPIHTLLSHTTELGLPRPLETTAVRWGGVPTLVGLTETELWTRRWERDHFVDGGSLPRPPGEVLTRTLTTADGSTLYLLSRAGGQTVAWRWSDGATAWEAFTTLPEGFTGHLRANARGVFALQYSPERTVVLLSSEGNRQLPEVAGDPADVELADLDGDGTSELYVATGPWNGYAITAYDAGLEVRDRYALRSFKDLLAFDTPDGPRLLATTEHVYADVQTFGEEASFGQGQHGLHVLEAPNGRLEPVDVLPYAPDRSIDHLTLLQGRGLLAGYEDQYALALWSALSDRPAVKVRGLELLLSIDLDLDGVEELVVTRDDRAIVVLGLGAEPIQPLPLPTQEDVPSASPSLDRLSRRSWERAARVAALGLEHEAAVLLQRQATMLDGVDSAAALHQAGLLFKRSGSLPEAEEALRRALSLQPNTATAEHLVDVLVAQHSFDAAHAVATVHLRGPPAAAAVAPWRDLLADDWTVHVPHRVAPSADGWEIETLGDQGVLASLPVEVTAPLHLRMAIELRDAELGTGLEVVLRDSSGVEEIRLGTHLLGGHGTFFDVSRCGPSSDRSFYEPMSSAHLRRSKLDLAIDDDRWSCIVGEQRRTQRHPALPTGPYTLELRTVTGLVAPARRLDATLSLQARGLVPRPGPRPDAAPPYATQALRDTPDRLGEVLADLPDGPRAHLLRLHPFETIPRLVEHVDRRSFSQAIAAAWTPAADHPARPAFRHVLQLSAFDRLDPAVPGAALLLAHRASLLAEQGLHGRARVLAERVLSEADEGAKRAHEQAALVLALLDRHDPARCAKAAERLARHARNPLWLARRLDAIDGLPCVNE